MDDTADLNRLIRELNAGSPAEGAAVREEEPDAAARDLRPAGEALDPARGESARLAGWLAALVEQGERVSSC